MQQRTLHKPGTRTPPTDGIVNRPRHGPRRCAVRASRLPPPPRARMARSPPPGILGGMRTHWLGLTAARPAGSRAPEGSG